jgi:hypothetical protein
MCSYLQPEEQRVHFNTGYTRLMAVVRAIFNQAGWWLVNCLQDAYLVFVFDFLVVDQP